MTKVMLSREIMLLYDFMSLTFLRITFNAVTQHNICTGCYIIYRIFAKAFCFKNIGAETRIYFSRYEKLILQRFRHVQLKISEKIFREVKHKLATNDTHDD